MNSAVVPPQVSIAAPYPEGAIIEYARWSERNGHLEGLWIPSRAWTTAALTVLSPRAGDRMRSRVSRGAEHVERVRTIAPGLEILRLISREPHLRVLAPGAMDEYKRLFDRAVAKRTSDSQAIIAMPGASEKIFDHCAGARVLHAVDGHPRAVNDLLRSTFGGAAAREIVSDRRVEQIERELAAADVVMVPSLLKKQQYASQGVDKGKIALAPYGVDLRRFFASDRANMRRRRPKLLFVGQVSYRKGVPLLIEAARGIDVDVEMIGPVVEPALLRALPENVVHRGAVAATELNEHMNGSDALILPSLEDAFGLVVLEALASGLPVLTTHETGAAEVVSEEDGWVIPAGQAELLRAAMRDIPLLLPNERRARALRTRSAGDDRTWDRFSTSVDEAIARAVEKRGSNL